MKKNFSVLTIMGTIMSIACFLYFFGITFMKVPTDNKEISSLILGYMGGIISSIVSFYFGSSHKDNTKSNTSTETESDETESE